MSGEKTVTIEATIRFDIKVPSDESPEFTEFRINETGCTDNLLKAMFGYFADLGDCSCNYCEARVLKKGG